VPSIVLWVVFNEGWGQHETPKFVQLARSLDSTRLLDNASGWTDKGVGDVIDAHIYPGPGSPNPEPKRAAVLGEFGGLGLPLTGHMWQEKDNWGYQTMKDRTALTEKLVELIRASRALIGSHGLSAFVYTQTSDVEIESNGLMTYDREILKPDLAKVRSEVLKLYGPIVKPKVIVEASNTTPKEWRYTLENPSEGWFMPKFDDSKWHSGKGGFGTKQTPGAVVKTVWNTKNIWLRRTFTIAKGTVSTSPYLSIHHDEEAEVYIDGKLVQSLPGFTTAYSLVPLNKDTIKLLQPGTHTLAVHCKQTGGGQYIDVGIVD
jgi:hypothetical protein